MQQWILKKMKDIAEQAEDVSFRTDYSGRGMYGRRCVGLTGSQTAVQDVIAELVNELVQDLFDDAIDCDEGEENAAYRKNDEVQEAIRKLLVRQSRDSMGLDVIVYWSNVQWQEEEVEK